ncbi:hypothetical protein D3C75_678470 [compost metagenome]
MLAGNANQIVQGFANADLIKRDIIVCLAEPVHIIMQRHPVSVLGNDTQPQNSAHHRIGILPHQSDDKRRQAVLHLLA